MLPIPKKYFWESGNTTLSLRIKLWHRSVFALGRLLHYAEYAGEVVSQVLGLNQSRYQYVMDGMTEEDWAKARKVNDERTREWEEFNAAKQIEKETGIAANQL